MPLLSQRSILLLIVVVPAVLVALPTAFIPALDHWVIDAVFLLVGDLMAAFSTVALLCGYVAYSSEPGTAVADAAA